MKNNKIILLSILTALILYLGFEISAGKVHFGSAWWSDTLSTRITTNKAINLRPGDSLYYNGNVVTAGQSIDTSNVGFLNQTNIWTEINEYENVSISTSLENIGTTTLVDATITGTLDASGDLVPGWTKNQSSHTELSYFKEKALKFKAPAVSGFTTVAHGVSSWRNIVEYHCIVKDDTTSRSYMPGNWYATAGGAVYCRVDGANMRVELGSTAYGLANDSGYIYIKYIDPDR